MISTETTRKSATMQNQTPGLQAGKSVGSAVAGSLS